VIERVCWKNELEQAEYTIHELRSLDFKYHMNISNAVTYVGVLFSPPTYDSACSYLGVVSS